MAVKAVVDTLDDVPEGLRPEYESVEGGKFALKVEGLEDGSIHPAVGALARAKKREADARGKAEAKVKELAEKLEGVSREREDLLKGVVPKENVERLETSYKEKLAGREAELNTEITRLNGSLREVLVDNVAHSIASKLVDDPIRIPVLLPHIAPRLTVEIGADGKANTRVLDREGKPSAATIDDLQKEFLANPMFSPLVLGSRATGSGASSGSGAGGAPQKIDLRKASLAEKEAYYKARAQQ
jgi:hypothetical protein